jgi:putative ABC transport system permease protein
MFKNYLLIAFRNLYRHKIFSFINIAGMAVGMAACMLIAAYILYEFSYDQYHRQADSIYRLIVEKQKEDHTVRNVMVHSALAPVLQKEFPEVKAFVHINKTELQFKYGNNLIQANGLVAGPDIFQIFSFPLISGDVNLVLSEPNTIVISERIARTYFAGKNPVGLVVENAVSYGPASASYTIIGVMKEIPANTHLQADVIVASKWKPDASLNWNAYRSSPQYILLEKGTKSEDLLQKMDALYKKYAFPENVSIRLQKLTDIHLHSDFEDEFAVTSDVRYMYIFIVAALLILLIGCINFVNLTTARSLHRAREVGVRKVLGAFRSQLIQQFLGESFLLFTIALLMGILLAKLVIPHLSSFVGIPSTTGIFHTYETGLLVLGLILIIGLLAGAYPAFYLSAQNPVFVLKGVLKTSMLNTWMRKILVVLQFTISVVLIIATLVVYNQLHYISTKRLGFDKEQLIIIPQRMGPKAAAFKQELLRFSGIENVAFSSWNPKQGFGGMSSMDDPKHPGQDITFDFISADYDFINTLGMELVEGRNFSAEHPVDDGRYIDSLSKDAKGDDWMNAISMQSIILNETTVKRLGLQSPVGQQLQLPALQGTVIGVVKDFHGKSLHHEVKPVVISAYAEYGGNGFIRVRPNNIPAALSYIEKQWKTFFPRQEFEFAFMDDYLQQLYMAEQRLSKLFGVFAFLGISIACLGLFGLATFTAEQRTKEIGIRKVLGAGIADIVALLSKDFIKLVLLAFLIASPLAWYLMHQWLQDFAYRIDISPWIFLLASVIALLIALLTVSYQSIKAALANPVKSLRSE